MEQANGESGDRIQPGSSEALRKWAWVLFIALALCFEVWSELARFSIWRGVCCLVLIAGLTSVLFPLWTRQQFGRFFGNMEYIRVSNPDLERRIQTRYQSEISELKSLEFEFLFFEGQAFLLVRLLLLYPVVVVLLMLWKREVLAIHNGNRILLGHPIFADKNATAYAQPIGLGVKFHSVFQDGTVLISANFGENLSAPRFTRRPYKGSSVSETWAEHQRSIESLEADGNQIKKLQISFEEFVEIIR